MRMPGFSAAASLYHSTGRYWASHEHTQGQPGRVVPAQRWGDFKADHCTKRGCWLTEGAGCGRRQFSAILWDIPWGVSWYTACYSTPGLEGRPPDRCRRRFSIAPFGYYIWGEWDIPDSRCDTEFGVGS